MIRIYLRSAIRFLLKNKTFSLINIFGLALGTLCCLYILLYVQDQYSYDRQHAGAEDLYRVNTVWSSPAGTNNWATVTAPVAPALQKEFPEVIQYIRVVPAFNVDYHLLRYKDRSIYEKDAVYADSGFFGMFNFHFIHGNAQTALAAPYSIVLVRSVATSLFGAQDPVGKTITLENNTGKQDYSVTGVIDDESGKSHIHANLFLSMNSGGLGEFTLHNNSWTGMNIVMSYVRLRPHTSAAAVEAKLPAIVNKYGNEQLKKMGMTKVLHLQPIVSIHTTTGFAGLELTKPVSPKFLSIMVLIAVLIQVIACINFMNLSTARASRRAKEVGVRKVAGAGRKELVKQFLGESLLLAFAGVAIALPLLIVALPYLNRITGADIPLSALDSYRTGIALLTIALITGLLAGSYPAFYLSAFQVIKVIKGNFTSRISASGIRRALVVFQFAGSITLITGIVIIYSQLNYIKNKDLGFDQRQKLVFPFYTDEGAEKIAALADDLRKLPEIDAVSRAAKAPGELLPFDMGLYKAGGNIASAVDASFQQVDEHFLKTTGIKLVSGRDFQRYDTGRIIINETLAKQLSIPPGREQGMILYTENNGNVSPLEIAGVMKDYNFSSLHDNIRPQFLLYTPEGGRELIVSTNSKDYPQLLSKLQGVWHRHLSDIPFQYRFVSDEVQKQYEAEAIFGNIIASFAGMAIFISCLGLFGLSAFNAEQRRKEISIRKVLGASVAGVAAVLSKEFLKLIALSFLIGAPIAAWAMSQWLQGFAFRVGISWWMFAVSGLLALFIALATIGFQAVKAALANPINSLREG